MNERTLTLIWLKAREIAQQCGMSEPDAACYAEAKRIIEEG